MYICMYVYKEQLFHTENYNRFNVTILWHVGPLLGNESVNTFPRQRIRRQQSNNFHCYASVVNITIEEDVFSMWFAYIHCWATNVFSMSSSRDYISSTEQNQTSRRTRTRVERVLGSHLLWAVVIDCDYEWLYKNLFINPTIQSKTRYYSSRSHKHVTICNFPKIFYPQKKGSTPPKGRISHFWHYCISRCWRVLTMVYNTQNYWAFGLCPAYGDWG
jgi:hypothetical protein